MRKFLICSPFLLYLLFQLADCIKLLLMVLFLEHSRGVCALARRVHVDPRGRLGSVGVAALGRRPRHHNLRCLALELYHTLYSIMALIVHVIIWHGPVELAHPCI